MLRRASSRVAGSILTETSGLFGPGEPAPRVHDIFPIARSLQSEHRPRRRIRANSTTLFVVSHLPQFAPRQDWQASRPVVSMGWAARVESGESERRAATRVSASRSLDSHSA